MNKKARGSAARTKLGSAFPKEAFISEKHAGNTDKTYSVMLGDTTVHLRFCGSDSIGTRLVNAFINSAG